MLRRLKRSRLALRIYVVGLVQIAVVFVGFVILTELNRQPPPSELHAQERRLVQAIEENQDDTDAIRRHLVAAREETGLEATVVDPTGKVLASTVPSDAPACTHRPPPREVAPRGPDWDRPAAPFLDPPEHARPHLGHPPGRPPGPPEPPSGPPPLPREGEQQLVCFSMAIPFSSGGLAQIEFRRTHSPPPSPFNPAIIALVLVVVAISSVFLARSLARPLRKLAGAARTLGAGDLSARTNIDRSDELGDVARAFDDMADRVADLLRAEKELVANVSHELRTPLARIRVALDIAAEGDAATVQESLTDITDDLQELERLIEDVLTAARLDLATDAPRGIPPLRKDRIELGELLAHAASRFGAAHPERPLELEVDDALPAVEGDSVLLRRVFDNLLENAHKYTEAPESPVALKACSDGGYVVIEVRDRGMGIAAQDLSGVFRPFFRVDRSRTRATGGLGLGLALAKRIVEAHGGTISLSSEPGEGTVASVRLPALA